MIRQVIQGHAYRSEGCLTECDLLWVNQRDRRLAKGNGSVRKFIAGFAVWFLAGLAVSLGLGGGHAEAHEGGLIPPVSVCNPDAFGGFNWRWVGCNHENHLHAQWRRGRGTPGHTVQAYRREARDFRAWLEGLDG